MKTSIPHFRKLVSEIQDNSWWRDITAGGKRNPTAFVYRLGTEWESATEVPKEPCESLLLRVRRLTMDKSCENLHGVRGELGRTHDDPNQRLLLDAWHKYWRTVFIKEPYEVQIAGKREVMTPFKVYDMMINGQLFHSNSAEYNVILHGNEQPTELRDPWLFFQMQFYVTVVNFCLAALGLVAFIEGMQASGIDISAHPTSVTDFIWSRNRLKELDEQYAVFSGWIEANGGCSKCRW